MLEVRADIRSALSMMRACALEAQQRGADLVCFPECFLQGYEARPRHVAAVALELGSQAFDEMLRVLSSISAVVVFGLIEKDGEGFYNSAVAVQRGRIVARYRKTHLLSGERSVFLPGDASPIFTVNGTRVAMNICYDLNFSASVERAAKSGARVLMCPCSNMMPRELAEEWKARHNEIRARHARTHGVWIVSADITGERDGCVSYGPTAVIDPLGIVVAQVPVMGTGMVLGEIH